MILEFKPLTLDQFDVLRPYFDKNLCRLCDCTIGGTFIWRDFFNTHYAIEDGVLYLRVDYFGGFSAFTPPVGDDGMAREHIDRLVRHCEETGAVPKLCAVSVSKFKTLLDYFPNSQYYSDRAWDDYLYFAEDLKTLAGRKFSGQRNHINKFLAQNSDWTFEVITQENLPETRDFFSDFAETHVRDSKMYVESNIKTLEVLDNYDKYGQFGGVLRAGGRIVGGAVGETVGDTMFVHIEKALAECHGAYQMTVNQFSKMFSSEGTLYINREEDDGIEGLRTSKLSYHPTALLSKFVVELRH